MASIDGSSFFCGLQEFEITRVVGVVVVWNRETHSPCYYHEHRRPWLGRAGKQRPSCFYHIFKAVSMIGFTGSHDSLGFDAGIFFPSLSGGQGGVKLFAAISPDGCLEHQAV